MRVATKLTGAFGLFIVILAGLLIFHIRTIRSAVRTNYELTTLASRAYIATTRQVIRIAALEENASKYTVTRDRGYLEKFEEALTAFEENMRRLETDGLSELTERERDELDRLRATWLEVGRSAARFREGLPTHTSAGANLLLTDLRHQLDELRRGTTALGEASQEAMVARLESSSVAARRAERIAWGVVAGALIIGILGSGLIIRSISEALRWLQGGTREVAAGNFSHRLEPRRDDEFAQLARDFNIMTERLGELDQMKKDFLSKVSHDLKTPLASMIETTRALLEEVPGPLTAQQERLLQLNHQGGERLSAMIAKILELSALEEGALGFDPVATDIVGMAKRALDEVRVLSGEEEVEIEVNLPREPVLVPSDEERIIRVLVNLLENAVKFSPRGGTVELMMERYQTIPPELPAREWERVAGPGGLVMIRTRDSGPGIPTEEREMIFERFFQGESGRRTQRRGVGLGLTICHEIVTAHRGTIWVEDAPGGGSDFVILLPTESGAMRDGTMEHGDMVDIERGLDQVAGGVVGTSRPSATLPRPRG